MSGRTIYFNPSNSGYEDKKRNMKTRTCIVCGRTATRGHYCQSCYELKKDHRQEAANGN